MNQKIINTGKRPAIEKIREILGADLIGAEIGVNKGYNAAYIFQVIKPKLLYLIDPWNGFFDPGSGEIVGEAQYLLTGELLRDLPYKIIRATSEIAVKDFQDGTLDFCYIDGAHNYQSVLLDITLWYPIVRKSGIISGHDFSPASPQIIQAVEEFCRRNNISKIFFSSEDLYIRKETDV